MKIAYLCQSYPPMISGAAFVVQRLANGMAARGHEILLISASDKGWAYIDRTNSLKSVRLRSYHNPLRVGQKFVVWARREISAEFHRFRPDVLHLHDPLNVGVSGLQAARGLDIPVILTIHQLPWIANAYLPDFSALHRIVEVGLWAYSKWVLQQCHRVIVPSHISADKLYSHGHPRPTVISNGVDLGWFTPIPPFPEERQVLCNKYGLDPVLPVILHVGRLDIEKRVEVIVRVAARVMQQVEAQLLVVGDGCRREALIQMSKSLGIGTRSHFPGYVDSEGDLPGLYRLAAVFATASEIENQSLVMLEALATGLPIIAVRATSTPELVRDSVNGYLVQPGAVDEMVDCMIQVLTNPALAKQMGQAGRVQAEKHSMDRSLDEHEVLYRSLVTQ